MGIELHIGGSLDFFLRRQHPHHSVRCPLKIPKGGGGEGVEGPEGIRQEHSDQWAPEGSPRARLDIRPDQCQPRQGWGQLERMHQATPLHSASSCHRSLCVTKKSLLGSPFLTQVPSLCTGLSSSALVVIISTRGRAAHTQGSPPQPTPAPDVQEPEALGG